MATVLGGVGYGIYFTAKVGDVCGDVGESHADAIGSDILSL
jgi:hypothetical protein